MQYLSVAYIKSTGETKPPHPSTAPLTSTLHIPIKYTHNGRRLQNRRPNFLNHIQTKFISANQVHWIINIFIETKSHINNNRTRMFNTDLPGNAENFIWAKPNNHHLPYRENTSIWPLQYQKTYAKLSQPFKTFYTLL